MKKVKLYSFEVCPFCDQAKMLLNGHNIEFEEIVLSREELAELSAKTKMMTVPQIFFGEKLIGGFTDLAALASEGKLQELLSE